MPAHKYQGGTEDERMRAQWLHENVEAQNHLEDTQVRLIDSGSYSHSVPSPSGSST